jgi:hypothetical protein
MSQLEGSLGLALCRAKARRLLQEFRSADGAKSAAAWDRFRRLRSFSDRAGGPGAEDRDRVRLKHALAVIAEENGYGSWIDLKSALESAALERDGWYARGMDVYLNRWFAHYEEARLSRDAEGGYLLPYRHHFFVCEADAIRLLGLDPDDPDWARIRWDCARPADREALARLSRRRGDRVS